MKKPKCTKIRNIFLPQNERKNIFKNFVSINAKLLMSKMFIIMMLIKQVVAVLVVYAVKIKIRIVFSFLDIPLKSHFQSSKEKLSL